MNIAMIGAGSYAWEHLNVLTKEPDAKIVGHVSPTPSRREASARRWGGRAYASCAELLEHEQVDAAWITVPPNAHGGIEESLVKRGIPFFVEKPLSTDRQTAERIAISVAERDLIVGVGYKFRASDALPEVRQALAKSPARLVLAAWHGGTPPVAWWQRQEMSGGQMIEQATHLFDLARYLIGEARVVTATADQHARPAYPEMTVADTSTALLEFGGGTKGVFTATCLLEGTSEIYLKLICEGLLITVTLDSVTFEGGGERRDVKVGNDLLVTENRAFIKAVKTNEATHVLSSYGDALLTHRLCFDVLEATQEGASFG